MLIFLTVIKISVSITDKDVITRKLTDFRANERRYIDSYPAISFDLVWFYGISTIVCYLMPNPFLYI